MLQAIYDAAAAGDTLNLGKSLARVADVVALVVDFSLSHNRPGALICIALVGASNQTVKSSSVQSRSQLNLNPRELGS